MEERLLGWCLIVGLVLIDIVLVLMFMTSKKNEGTLLSVYKDNGEKVKKESKYIYLVPVILLFIVVVVFYILL